jgi:hypothetical protein
MPPYSTFNDKYWGDGFSISRDVRGSFPHSRTSAIRGTYPSASNIHDRVDGPIDHSSWYRQTFADCYLGDFLWGTAMQTECKQSLRRGAFPDRDKVLEALIDRGVRDKKEPDVPNMQLERSMRHASSMAQRLLVRIENLEAQVSFFPDNLVTNG